MKKLIELLNESKEVHPILCMRLQNRINKKYDSYVIFWPDPDKNWDYTLFPNLGNMDGKVFGEISKIYDALYKTDGDGYKAAVELDRENDLYEITEDDVKETKHIPWFAKWWKEDGGQPWIVDAQK